MYILSRKEMQYYDNVTINNFKIPGRILMENAGRGCAHFIEEKYGETVNKVIIFCGSGNNGGDGFVTARWLKNNGMQVVIIQVDKEEKMSEETKANYLLLSRLQIPVFKIHSFEDWVNVNMNLKNFDLIVDAVFGIGFKGKLNNWKKDLFAEINAVSTPIISIDVASGIDVNTGLATQAIKADYTLTMSDYKYGHFIGDGRIHSGSVVRIPIGIPFKIYQQYTPHAIVVHENTIKFPPRNQFYYKGNYGKVGIIAGSEGYSGAAIMASRAALRSGSGLITLFHQQDMRSIYENQLLEVMTRKLPTNDEGFDIQKSMEQLNKMDVLLIGPGWGKSAANKALLEEIIWTWKKPLVLDADALNILAEEPRLLKQLKDKPVVLTPHYGEFARLLQKSVDDLKHDPVNLAVKFAKKYKINLLLKNISTLYTDGNKIKIDISGNDGLATGGSGDVLAGIITSFLAQSLPIEDAAISASYLMGKTAEKVAEKRKTPSITPSDIIDNLFAK